MNGDHTPQHGERTEVGRSKADSTGTDHTAAYTELKENGPAANAGLQSTVKRGDRENGVLKFSLRTSNAANLSLPRQTVIFYINKIHTPKDVLDAWVAENHHIVDANTGLQLHRPISRRGDSWRDASKDVFNPDLDAGGGGGAWSPGGECPMCGEGYGRYLSDHLPCGGDDE